ncbi:MAG: hypothetical protein Q7P63_01145 [Verrucomicrobiota bacterium JB022]|nr:hypothetical protein [Verrucomicrobiota bacterium JB022]
MNQRQIDEAEGFAELLTISGIELTHKGSPFQALLGDIDRDAEPYDLTPGDDDAVTVKTWLSSFPGGLPREGAYFEDASGASYRLISADRKPAKLTVIFTCSVTYS